MPFSIVRSDIARLDVDAVVNAANEGLLAGGGVCGAIFSAAGYGQLQAACRKIAPCPTGGAMVTRGFDLPARWIIHAVGPRWIDGHHGEEGLLRRAYRSALDQAARLQVASVAFPLISAGIYGYPPAAALDVACEEIARFLSDRAGTDAGEMRVVLAVYDRQAFAESLDCYDEVSLCIQDAQGEESFLHATAPYAHKPRRNLAISASAPVSTLTFMPSPPLPRRHAVGLAPPPRAQLTRQRSLSCSKGSMPRFRRRSCRLSMPAA